MPLPKNWELPEQVRIRVGKYSSGRQRAIYECEHLLLILHKAPGQHDSHRESVFFWRQPNGTWRCSENGDAIAQLKSLLDHYAETEDRLALAYARAISAADYFCILEELVPLNRAARNLHVALQTARESVADADLIDLRNFAADNDRAMELLLLDTRNALDFDVARTAEQQARFSEEAAQAGHRLNILACLFFPVTALASVFGMNLPIGLEDSPVWISWLTIFGGVLLGYLMLGWVTRYPMRHPPEAAPTATHEPSRPDTGQAPHSSAKLITPEPARSRG